MNRYQDSMDQEHSLQRHLLTVCLTPMELCFSHFSDLIPSHNSATHTWNKQKRKGLTLLGLFKFKTDFHFTSPFCLKLLSTHDFRIKYLCKTHQFAFFLIFPPLVVVLYVYNIEEGCVVEKSFNVLKTWNILGKIGCFLFSIPNLRPTLKAQLRYYLWVSPLFIPLCLM